MRTILIYLIVLFILTSISTIILLKGDIEVGETLFLPALCSLCGCFGGITYCLRGIYINVCVRKNWDKDWHVWYYLRPIVSFIVGGVSYIFLKAGLLVLDTNKEVGSSVFGFLALAYIAGLNVDKFLSKLEDLAETTFGIEKSKASSISKKNKN